MKASGRQSAFLVIAHNDAFVLKKQLEMLDSAENDIYLHIDKRWKTFPWEEIRASVRLSGLYRIPSMKVYWGTYSLIQCELNLLKAAAAKGYQYYHLISGVDLPLKTPREINSFCALGQGKEYIEYQEGGTDSARFLHKIRYYHFFRKKIGKTLDYRTTLWGKAAHILFLIQRKLNVDRIGNQGQRFWKGSEWCSITHDLAEYVISQEKWIKKRFRLTLCGDEIFIQTLAANSPFASRTVNDSMRYIVWDEANDEPVTFENRHYEELMESGAFFARKFSSQKNREIIEKIYEKIMERKEKEREENGEKR